MDDGQGGFHPLAALLPPTGAEPGKAKTDRERRGDQRGRSRIGRLPAHRALPGEDKDSRLDGADTDRKQAMAAKALPKTRKQSMCVFLGRLETAAAASGRAAFLPKAAPFASLNPKQTT